EGRKGAGYVLNVFGRSGRASNCDCDRSNDASLLQTVYLQNDQELLATIDRKGGWLAEVVKVASAATANSDAVGPQQKQRNQRRKGAAQQVAQLQKKLKKTQ